MPPWVAEILETLLVPECFLEEGGLGAGREEKGRHWKKAREICARNGQCLAWLELGGGSLLEGQDRERQQGAPMWKPGRGSVISGVLLFGISGPSLPGAAQEEGAVELFQAVGPGWATSDEAGGSLRGPWAFLVLCPLFSV